MTARPEYRYICDRCGEEANIAMDSAPGPARARGPEGWAVMVVGAEPNTPPHHLCPPCAGAFTDFLRAGRSAGM